VDDLIAALPSLAEEDLVNIDFGTYTQAQFFDDLLELTQYRADPELTDILVRNSLDTAKWLVTQGVKLQPGLGRQAYKVDGKFKFWGGLALHIWGGGPEMLKALYANVERRGIPIYYETPAVRLVRDGGRIGAVIAERRGVPVTVTASAVVLACGSFESNPEMRARYLGPGWDLAKVRGTRFNMGAGLDMALAIGARPAIGQAATPSPGTSMRRPMATLPSAINSRNTIIRSAFSSTPGASAMSTRAPISTATLMRNTAPRS
jgi:tricarballylate dehydrogenase